MQFEITELPQKQLALIGLTGKDILSLPPRTLNALLSGNRTSLIRFTKVNIPGMSSHLSLDARLSLERKPDNSVSLKIHPINQSAKNSFNLTKEELSYLANGETNFVSKQIKDAAGKLNEYLVTLDKTTKEFVAVRRDHILAPEVINGTALTEQQKTDFKNGKDIAVGDGSYKLDPNSESGVKENNNKPVKNLQLKHSSYSENELLIDLALLTSGLGHFVLLEHLANLALHSGSAMMKSWKEESHLNKPLRDALAKASPELTDTFKQTQKISAKEIQALVEHHLGGMTGINNQDEKIRRQYSADYLPQNFDGLTTKELNSLSIDIRDSYESKGYLTDDQRAAKSIINQKLSGEEIKPLTENHLGGSNELNKTNTADSNTVNPSAAEIAVEEKTEVKIIHAETPQLSANDSPIQKEEKQDVADEIKEESKKTIQVKI